MLRPTINKPDWFVTDPAKLVEPSGSKKNTGWSPAEPHPAQNENWLMYSISLWLEYLDTIGAKQSEVVDATRAINEDDNGRIIFIDSTAGSFDLDLPDPATFANMSFRVIDRAGNLSTNPVLLDRFGTEAIAGLTQDYVLQANFGSWEIYCNGSNYFIL